MRQGLQSVLLCLLMIFGSLSGCFGSDEQEEEDVSTHWLPDVENRSMMIYDNTDVFSRVSINGSYETMRSCQYLFQFQKSMPQTAVQE